MTLLAGSQAVAEPAGIVPYEPPRNEAYLKRVRLSRLQTELIYVEILNGPIPLGPAYGFEPPGDRPPEGTEPLFTLVDLNRVLLFIFALFAAAILIRIVKTVRPLLRPDMQMPGQERTGTAAPGAARSAAADPLNVDRLRAWPDRRAALVELVNVLLGAAARHHDLRLGRAETAREFLRRVPPDWVHMSNLRRVVMTEELVQFGGRPLSDSAFEDCIRRAAPILSGSVGMRS